MRFVLNFILFGFIYFLIWRYIPDFFDMLVTWVNTGWDWVIHNVQLLVEKIQGEGR